MKFKLPEWLTLWGLAKKLGISPYHGADVALKLYEEMGNTFSPAAGTLRWEEHEAAAWLMGSIGRHSHSGIQAVDALECFVAQQNCEPYICDTNQAGRVRDVLEFWAHEATIDAVVVQPASPAPGGMRRTTC